MGAVFIGDETVPIPTSQTAGGLMSVACTGEDCCGNGVSPCPCNVTTSDCGVSWDCPTAIETRIVQGETVFTTEGQKGKNFKLPVGSYLLQCRDEVYGPWKDVSWFEVTECSTHCCDLMGYSTATYPFHVTLDFGAAQACFTGYDPTPLSGFNGTYILSSVVRVGGVCTYEFNTDYLSWPGVPYYCYLRIRIIITTDGLMVELTILWPQLATQSIDHPAGCYGGRNGSWPYVKGGNCADRKCATGVFTRCYTLNQPDVYVRVDR